MSSMEQITAQLICDSSGYQLITERDGIVYKTSKSASLDNAMQELVKNIKIAEPLLKPYREKTKIFGAVKVTKDNIDALTKLDEVEKRTSKVDGELTEWLEICRKWRTKVMIGDYLMEGDDGKIYLCDALSFEEDFEPVTDGESDEK